MIYFFYAAFTESLFKPNRRLRPKRENQKSRGVPVQTVDKKAFSFPRERGKYRLGIDAAFLIDHQHVFILVNGIKSGLFLLFGRKIISDFIPRRKKNVFSRLFSVYFDLFISDQIIPEKRALRIGVVGKFFQGLRFLRNKFFHLCPSRSF